MAIDPSNVLVLYNQASPEGAQIKDHYVQAHPGVQVLGLSGVSLDEEVTADEYLNVIRPQVLSALNSSTELIVTTKGLPLRIYNSLENPGTYDGWVGNDFPFPIPIADEWWKQYSSLESELTRIDLIDSPELMGDQAHLLGGTQHHARNPYYNQAQPFDRSDPANQGIRLTARLDGFSVQDVNAAIDRAQQVFVVPQYHYVVVDDDPNAAAGDLDLMPELKDNVLVPREQAFVFDSTNAAITAAPGPVIGYVSHGVNDRSGGLHHGYISDELQFELANGAVFHTHESFNAVSFEAGGNQGGQGLVAEWLAVGGTAGVGHVEEPSAGLFNVTNEDILFDRLLDGFTLAEAAWAATWQLSYVNTVVGDPLMVMRPALPGDANLNGVVDFSDFMQVQGNFGQVGGWTDGDFNGDGIITFADFMILQGNLGASADSSGPGAVPEPATGLLVLIGAGLACRRPRRCSASR